MSDLPPSNDPPDPKAPATGRPLGGDRRRLDRAPGERYAGTAGTEPGRPASSGRTAPPAAGPGRPVDPASLVLAVIVADAVAVLFFVVGLLDSLRLGLLVVAAFGGWLTAIALVRHGREGAIGDARLRVAVAAFLGGWAVVAGMLIDWVYALVQGGVLGPVEYVLERYGVVALVALVIAAGVAAARAR